MDWKSVGINLHCIHIDNLRSALVVSELIYMTAAVSRKIAVKLSAQLKILINLITAVGGKNLWTKVKVQVIYLGSGDGFFKNYAIPLERVFVIKFFVHVLLVKQRC